MNFQEQYQKEMNEIKHTPELTKMAFQMADQKKNYKFHLRSTWKLAVAVMAAICIIGGVTYGDEMASFAKSIWGSFTLSTDEETMVLDPIKPIPFDQEAFIADENTETDEDFQEDNDPNYSQTFSDYYTMNKVTNLELPGADHFEYKNISVTIHPAPGYGQISAQVVYNQNKFDINAMFAIGSFGQEEWGYGENEKIKETYKYSDGKKAYFVDKDTVQTVYFSEGDILFQLFVNQTEKATAEAKKMLSTLSAQ